MEATLSIDNTKVLITLLTALSKYDNVVTFTVRKTELLISTVNKRKSAWGGITLHQSFFSTYDYSPMAGQPEFIASVLTTVFMHPLKSAVNPSSRTLSVRMSLRYPAVQKNASLPDDSSDDDDSATTINYRVLVSLYCAYDVKKVWTIHLLEPDSYFLYKDEHEEGEQIITLTPARIDSIVSHIKRTIGQPTGRVQFWIYETELVMCTYSDSDISTDLSMAPSDFPQYNAGKPEMSIDLHIREFDATIECASDLHHNISLAITEAPAPLILRMSATPLAQDGTDGSWFFFAAIATTTPSSDPPKRHHPQLSDDTLTLHHNDPIEDADDLLEDVDVVPDDDNVPETPMQNAPLALPPTSHHSTEHEVAHPFKPVHLNAMFDKDEEFFLVIQSPTPPSHPHAAF